MPSQRFELSGVVERYDFFGQYATGPTIGGVDVIAELQSRWGRRYDAPQVNVKVWLGVEPVKEGPLWTCHGFSGTDVTPPESPEIRVGGWDLIDRLTDLDGREVVLIVEDA